MNRLAFCSVLLATAALAEDDVSRAGRQLNFVVALHAPALSSPSTNLNLAADEAQQAKYANRITPVGQRQQFLIGSELRKRYVEEAQLLNEEYIISQMHLQAPFVAKNILSLQAQMMGLYPATNVNDLNEWQQANAVPPIEGADFSKWQAELGAHALPYGLQTFPIQQTGFESDFMLSLNAKNCQRFDALTKDSFAQISTNLATEIAAEFSDIAAEMTDKDVSGKELCDYLTWAQLNAVPLVGDETRQAEYKKLATETCPAFLYNPTAQAVLSANSGDNNLVATGFLTQLRDTLQMLKSKQAEGVANQDELPLAMKNFQAFSADILLAIASSIATVDETAALPASSNLIMEYWTADDSIHAYLNDEEVPLLACCDTDGPCTADAFITFLDSAVTYTDLASTCADTEF